MKKQKRLIPIIILFVMIFNCFLPVLPMYAEEVKEEVEVEVEEPTINGNKIIKLKPELYEAIKTNIQNQPDGKKIIADFNDSQYKIIISQEQIDSIETLVLKNFNITDLTGLENFKNLKTLNLSGNKLTSDSKLEVLNELTLLEDLDLSSNNIKDISMLTNWEKFKERKVEDEIHEQNSNGFLIQNQNYSEVIVLDSDIINGTEFKERTLEEAMVLPEIMNLVDDFDEFKYYYEDRGVSNAIEIKGRILPYNLLEFIEYSKNISNSVEFIKEGDNPYKIDFALKNQNGEIISRMIDLEIKFNAGVLTNTTIKLHYVVLNEEERAAVFKDNKFYNVIKAQLTEDEEISSGDEIKDYTAIEDLYKFAHDEAKVLVFDIDKLINKIPDLRVENSEVSDISGIEAFVGVRDINLNYNYITSLDPIIKLQENKIKEETKLQEKVKAKLAEISELRDGKEDDDFGLAVYVSLIEETEIAIEDMKKKIAEGKATEQDYKDLYGGFNDEGIWEKGLYEMLEELVLLANSKKGELTDALNELYVIYNKYYRGTTILIPDIYTKDTLNVSIDILSSQFEKIKNLEKNDALSDFEKDLIVDSINNSDEFKAGYTETDDKGKPLDNPISAYLNKYYKDLSKLNYTEVEAILNEIIKIDAIALFNYNFTSIEYNGLKSEYGNKINISLGSFLDNDNKLEKYGYDLGKIYFDKDNFDVIDITDIKLASKWDDEVRIGGLVTNKIPYSEEEVYNMVYPQAYEDVLKKYFVEGEIINSDTRYTIMIELAKDDKAAGTNVTEELKTAISNYDSKGSIDGLTKADKEMLERRYTKDSRIIGELIELLKVEIDTTTKEYVKNRYVDPNDPKWPQKSETVYEYTEMVPGQPNVNPNENAKKSLSQVLGVSGKIVYDYENEVPNWVFVEDLKNLQLYSNKITKIDALAEAKIKDIYTFEELEGLNVGNNEIQDITNVEWGNLKELKGLDLSENAIQYLSKDEIPGISESEKEGASQLTDLIKLQSLNLSKNKLSGKFMLKIRDMVNLMYADFSYNAYDDLKNLIISYAFEAGTENIYEYAAKKLHENGKEIYFNNQKLPARIEQKIVLGEQVYIKVPSIITQFEKMDPKNTRFDYNGFFEGKIVADGVVQLVTNEVGHHTAQLTVGSVGLGENKVQGVEDGAISMGHGTVYNMQYEVVYGTVDDIIVSVDEENRDYAILDGKTKLKADVHASEYVTDTSVTWSLKGHTSANTKVDYKGVLTIGFDEEAEEIVVTATSKYDNNVKVSKLIRIKKADVVVKINEKAQNSVKPGDQIKYTTTVNTEAENKRLEWSITGAMSPDTKIEELDDDGKEAILTIGEDEPINTKIVVTAKSKYNSEKSATLTETVSDGSTTPGNTTPGNTTPGNTTPGNTTPGNTTPGNTTPGNTTPPVNKIKINYTTKDETVYVEKPKTTIKAFVDGLVDGEHTVTVSDGNRNKITDYNKFIATGMVICIDNSLQDTYEVVVYGDIDGDGKIETRDSKFIQAHRTGDNVLEGAYLEAADLDRDGRVNRVDSFLLLYYRATLIDNFSKATIDDLMK